MSDNNEDKSVRVNVRIPRKQYDLMKTFGEVLGLETDGACVKHFVTLGLQSAAGGISAIQSVQNSADSLAEIKRMNDAVEQLDMLRPSRARV